MMRMSSVAAALALALVAADAAAERRISFAPYALPESGTVAIAVREGVPAEGAFAQLDAASQGALRRAVTAMDFKGERDSQLDLPGIAGYDRVIVLGIGDEPVTPHVLENVGGLVGQAAAGSASPRIELLWPGDAGVHLAFGAALGEYRFDKYRERKDEAAVTGEGDLVIRTPAGAAPAAVYQAQWQPVAAAVRTARDLVTEPGNVIYPEAFVARTREAFAGLANVRIEVLDVPAMERLGMGGILAVGKGSARPPRLLVVRYDGGPRDQAPLAFVGKGITFDTGGISLKESDGMWQMKYDMTGAASVTATVLALAGRRAAVNAVAVSALAGQLLAAGEASGERVWRMPLHPSYGKDMESPIADLRNGGVRNAGAGIGAYFIGSWIEDGMPWAHLDIAGMAWRESEGLPTSPQGATAFGVRLLDRFVREYHE